MVWSAIGGGFIVMSVVLPEKMGVPSEGLPILRYLPLLPLTGSVVVRWMILPRLDVARSAFTAFILGLALAEASGIIGIILGQGLRITWIQLAFLGIGQFIPLFAGKFTSP
jgi:hypothetical protein